MSWSVKKKIQALVAAEEGTIRKDWGGKIAIALVYPNTYTVGMSNLGFQTIYWHLNQMPDVVCERVFLPDPEDLDELKRSGTAPFSLESMRPLADFHLIGFSVTFEGDYVNVLRLLTLAGIPLRARDRRAQDPLVLMGGVCAFSNPEPVAPFMDFIAVGEGEELAREIVAAYRDDYHDRDMFLDRLTALEGIYVPERYDIAYDADGFVAEVVPRAGARPIVTKRRLRDVNAFETISLVKTPNAEYGHMALLEVGKGCGRGCRFCLEGQVYRPVRHRTVDALRETVQKLAAEGATRIGLVGACVSDYPWIGQLLDAVQDAGMEVSISSIRADSLSDSLASALARGGHRTLTIAPEAGTDRLRRVIRKAISDEQILAACDLVRQRGIPNLKTYFMIGQPTETLEDVEAIGDLAERMLDRLRVLDPSGKPFGRLTLSISSFVPKPWTPFQWAQFDGADSLARKLDVVKKTVRRFSNVRVLHENPREAALQALLARGDRRVADFLEVAAGYDGDWRRALREWDGDPEFYTTRTRAVGERMPWDHFDVGVKKAGLVREWERAHAEEPAVVGAS
ncbi:MAG: radical SAM protein [Candidatus Rokubacteria bacterium]|nr:radical SAM protein [Candidatus Rokubacteria bacterium]